MEAIEIREKPAYEQLLYLPVTHGKRTPTNSAIYDIIDAICSVYNIDFTDIKKRTRKREIVEPRQMLFYFARLNSVGSLQSIANLFDMDHATVLHGCRQIKMIAEYDRYVRKNMEMIQYKLDNIKHHNSDTAN